MVRVKRKEGTMAKEPIYNDQGREHPFGASAPVPKPSAKVSIDGGPHIQVKTVEGQALIAETVARINNNQAYLPVIRINEGPEIKYDRAESIRQLVALQDVNEAPDPDKAL